MSHTYTTLLVHLVFSTKSRVPWLDEKLRARVFPYMNGIVKELHGKALIINGMADHAHMLLDLPSALAPADAVRIIKTNSTRWVHDQRLCHEFHWQIGYGAFAIGRTEREMVIRYIEQQEAHHRSVTFQDEFLQFLHDYDVEYDPRYLWD